MTFEQWWEMYTKTLPLFETYPNIAEAAWHAGFEAGKDSLDEPPDLDEHYKKMVKSIMKKN